MTQRRYKNAMISSYRLERSLNNALTSLNIDRQTVIINALHAAILEKISEKKDQINDEVIKNMKDLIADLSHQTAELSRYGIAYANELVAAEQQKQINIRNNEELTEKIQKIAYNMCAGKLNAWKQYLSVTPWGIQIREDRTGEFEKLAIVMEKKLQQKIDRKYLVKTLYEYVNQKG